MWPSNMASHKMKSITQVSALTKQRLRDLTEGWSKWQVAVAVGAPIALGVAGLWYYNRSKSAPPKLKNDFVTVGRGAAGDVGGKDLDEGNGQKSPSKSQSRQELAQSAKTKGNKFFKDGKFEEAIQCYSEAITTCPPDIKLDMSTFYQNRAAAHEGLKNYESVVEDCTAALELNPKYSKALARRSKAYEVLEKYRSSLEDITKACLLEGFQNQIYLQAADRVLKTLGKSKALKAYKVKEPAQPSKFYVENYLAGFVNDPVALKFEPRGSKTEEEKLKEMGVKIKPNPDTETDNGAVLLEKPSAFERAKSCLSSGDYSQVSDLCDEELSTEEASPHTAQVLLLRGTMRLLQGQGHRASEDFSQLTQMEAVDNRTMASALIREGSLLMQRDSSEAAIESFNKAQATDPDNSDVYHHYGQQLLQLEKLDEAIDQFDKSIGLSPQFPTSYVQKYYALHRKAIMKEDLSLLNTAKSGFEETIQKFPKCSDALVLYAQALSDQGKYDEADKFFKKAQEVQPGNANNLVHRGLMTLQWKGNVEKTVELLQEALVIDAKCQYAYEIRGTIEVQRGNLKEAVKSFHHAIALSNSEGEMAHLFSLMEAAEVQVKVAKDLNIQLPTAMV